jgi:hypothetical protein
MDRADVGVIQGRSGASFARETFKRFPVGGQLFRQEFDRYVARQAQVGALLTSSFGPRALRITTPDIGYEIPYASITHIRRFGDVLVGKPNNHLVMALPMELVPPRDLALIESKVANRSVREASAS